MATVILKPDEDELLHKLKQLPGSLRVAFAAACAERQPPNYRHFSEASGQGAPEVWDDIEAKPAANEELEKLRAVCETLLPDEEQRDRLGYYAEDAVSSVCYALGTRLRDDLQEAIWASRCALNALDEFVNDLLDIKSFGEDQEQRVLIHPLIQAELVRQRDDLAFLHMISGGNIDRKKGISELRRRAHGEAKTFFGAQSMKF